MVNTLDVENLLLTMEPNLDILLENIPHLYDSRKIKKKKGHRELLIPHEQLMQLQRLLLKAVLYNHPAHRNAHGFVQNKSRITNAARHTSRRIILKLDIENFFPSITSNRIYGLFCSLGYSKRESVILTKLCTYKNQLPQGAPTSPYLSNLICIRLDARLSGLARDHNLNYSRYADDMTFSGGKINKRMIELIQSIVLEEGFKLNKYKTKIKSQKNRQDVTGIILNDKISLGHKNFNSLKGKLNSLRKSIDAEDISRYKQQILGEISIYKHVNSWQWYKLMDYYNKINWTNCKIRKPLNELEEQSNDIYTLLLALNSLLSDLFRPRKDIFDALKNNPKNSREIFYFNMQKLNLIFSDPNDNLYFFFRFISDIDKQIIKNDTKKDKIREHINLMNKFGINNNIDVEILTEVSSLAAFVRHPGKKLTKKVNAIFQKYDFDEKSNNYEKIYMGLIKNYKIMLEKLLNFAQNNKN